MPDKKPTTTFLEFIKRRNLISNKRKIQKTLPQKCCGHPYGILQRNLTEGISSERR